MNKRVHLPPDERRDQIVQGALQIFAERGFDATSNKEIARVAGIASTGLIYHYFKDKTDLLRAVIEMHMRQTRRQSLLEQFPEMPLEEGLRLFVRHFLEEITDPKFVSFTRVLLGEALRRPEFARILSEVMEAQMFTVLPRFFQYHRELGNIREIDPVLTTVRFVGSGMSIFMMREVLQIPAVRALDLETIANGLVEDFLRGVLP